MTGAVGEDARVGDEGTSARRTVRYEEGGAPGVRILTIDRPGKRNAIGPEEARGLEEAIRAFRTDPDARVLVMTGAGHDAFCAGADLGAVAAMAGAGDGDPLFIPRNASGPASPVAGNIGPTREHDLLKPVIAAVNGAAYAGGLEWACFAHLRIADRHASFGVTNRRWNIGLGDGGTQRLPRLIGLGRALDLILTGRVIGAQEAERIGLVNEVTASGQCLERALELASNLASLPQGALRSDLEATLRGDGLPLESGLEVERECFDRLLSDPELTEGANRFLRREHPDREAGAPALHPPTRAWSFACEAHAGRVDRFGRDFIVHPAAVAELSLPFGGEEALVPSYLHDTVEKGDADPAEIERLFGSGVRRMVETLGQDPAIPDHVDRRIDHRRRVSDAGPVEKVIYLNDRRESILTMSDLVESGRDPAEFGGSERLDLWEGDLEAIREMDLPDELVAQLESELGHLSDLIGEAGPSA